MMLLELFTFGGYLWWALVITASLWIIRSLLEEKGARAGMTIVGFLLLWQFFGDLQLQNFDFSSFSFWNAVGIIAGYIGVGVTWGVIKWGLFVGEKKDLYEDLKKTWLSSKGISGNQVPENLKEAFRSYLCATVGWYSHYSIYNKETKEAEHIRMPVVKPIANNNKAKIIRWMAYWPWSMAWAMLDDVWHKVFKWAQARVADIMDGITNWRFKGVEEDFTVKSEEKEKET